ncbi:MAG: hypothetical protein ACKVUT_16845 [Gaiella sp.]
MVDDRDAGAPPPLVEADPVDGPSAWRLTFVHDESGVRLVERERLEMVAPPDDSDLTYVARSGYWVELKDAEGRGIYRQILHDPLRTEIEVHSPDASEQPHQVPMESSTSTFDAVVPDLPAARTVVLKGRPSQADFAAGDAVALLTEPLDAEPENA